MTFGVVIPARLAATRLPNKPLISIQGRPLVCWVLDAAHRAGADFVVVAADDERIVRVVEEAGGRALLTSPEHLTGTDRLAEVARHLGLPGDSIIVNWQGDEPLLAPELVARVARCLAQHSDAAIATLATPLRTTHELLSPHAVKVVLDARHFARSFSRAPMPWARDAFAGGIGELQALPEGVPFLRHIGLYAYRVDTLLRLTSTAPPAWELAESLEQLRALWLGLSIHVTVVDDAPHPGVDTPADLERVAQLLGGLES